MNKTVIAALLMLLGCTSPRLPELQLPPRNVEIRLHASAVLNAGNGKQPYALVARIYKLRQTSAFLRMHFNNFLSQQSEREILGNDLLEVTEVMLIPGQRYEISEKITREAHHIGVVALFRAPAPNRWRMVAPAADAERNGITIGLHACAISTGQPLAPVRCD